MSELLTSVLPTPKDEATPQKSKKPFKAKRDGKRQENFREKKSVETDQQHKKAIFEKLYFGFKQPGDAMKSLQIVSTPRSVILPITTRAIGFIIRMIICKFARLQIRNVPIPELCFALYRITLLQFEFKIQQAFRNQFSKNTGQGFYVPVLTTDETQALGSLGAYFAPLTNLISAIGVFKAFGTQYIPRISNQTTRNNIRRYDPALITFSNLREYVVFLSVDNPHTLETRIQFYQHSPLPNALWNVNRARGIDDIDIINPVLLNPHDIMPAVYTLAEINTDITIIMDAIELIGRKYDKYVFVGGLDFNSQGNWSQLVSNSQDTIRCTDLAEPGLVDHVRRPLNYNITDPITGTIDYFWSLELISEPEFYFGSLHLLGENPVSDTAQRFSPRVNEVSKQDGSFDYLSGLTNLLG